MSRLAVAGALVQTIAALGFLYIGATHRDRCMKRVVLLHDSAVERVGIVYRRKGGQARLRRFLGTLEALQACSSEAGAEDGPGLNASEFRQPRWLAPAGTLWQPRGDGQAVAEPTRTHRRTHARTGLGAIKVELAMTSGGSRDFLTSSLAARSCCLRGGRRSANTARRACPGCGHVG